MKLKEWAKGEIGRSAALAHALGVVPSYVFNMNNGIKPIPIKHMAAIEAFTGGLVTRQEMRPDDWADIWPELVSTDNPAT